MAAAQPPPWREDRILLKPKPGHDAAALAAAKARHRLQVHRAYPGMEGLEVLTLPAGASVLDALQALKASGQVEFAEPDYRVQATEVIPNDPQYLDGTQWALNNPAGTGDLNAPEGWAIQNSASNIIVAVIDTGVRLTHRDLADNLWRNPREIAGNGVDDDGNKLVDDLYGINAIGTPNSTNVMDDAGHGTHVAGIIGAVGNNGIGISGVAWKVQIMACKFLDSTGNGYISDAVECFDYARLNGAKVINASFGATNYSSSLDTAINACRTAGIIVVAAAGNDGANNDTTPTYPANLGITYGRDNVVAVAATDRYDQLAYFSNYGSNTVHVAAPGYAIYSTYFAGDDSYTYLSGTSMAAPQVAGVLALMRARFPIENHQQIIRRMMESVDVLPSLAGRTRSGGRVNLQRALANYQMLTNAYNWITVSNATALTLANDGVSAELPMHMNFNFYGRNYSTFYVGANGLLGFMNQNLNQASNNDFTATNAPLAVLCPFWDDLNPTNGGTVTVGFNRTAPNRQVVVSWNTVPRASSTSTKLTFQAVLEENSQRILFQYQEVQPTRTSTGGGGRSATVGIRNHDGTQAVRYTVNGSPFTLANKTALAFVPLPAPAFNLLPKTNLVASGNAGGPFAPASLTYTLTNQGNTTLNWQANASADWISLTATGGVLTVGQSEQLTVAFNTNASRLPGGTYATTVSFSLGDLPSMVDARTVLLTVTGTNALLEVTPEAGLSSAGFTGGPFSPGNALYTLVNTGDAATSWAASAADPWVTLSATNGVLAPGASMAVSASINAEAGALPAGAYTNALDFLNLTTGNGNARRLVALSVNERPGILEVLPVGGYGATGVVGETFAPGSMDYTLTNSGTGPLAWEAAVSSTWAEVVAATGSLAPGQATNVTVRLTAEVQALAPGTYYATIDFANRTTGAGNTTRALTLQANPKPGKLLVLPEVASLTFTGMVGGPIAFTNQSFVLTNAGATNLFWSAADEQGWLSCTPVDGSLAAGESASLLVTLSSNAFSLTAGSHSNKLRLTSVNGTDSTQAIAFVLDLAAWPPTNAALTVLPAAGADFTGWIGGPFSPTGMVYTLVNTGDLATAWEAAVSDSWLTLSLTNGLLTPGATNQVVVTINTNAAALDLGEYAATIEFRNVSAGTNTDSRALSLQMVPPPGILQLVAETNRLQVSGFGGGPIWYTNQALALTNAGGSNLAWMFTRTEDWLEVRPSNGFLDPGMRVDLQISLAESAYHLPAGCYTNRLRFVTEADEGPDLTLELRLAPRPLLSANLSAGCVQFQVPTLPGRTYVCDYSTNLVDWTPLTTNVGQADGWLSLTNEAAQPWQFFRVRTE